MRLFNMPDPRFNYFIRHHVYTPQYNYYRTPAGEVTTERKGNEPIAVAGSSMSHAAARELGLPGHRPAPQPQEAVAPTSPGAIVISDDVNDQPAPLAALPARPRMKRTPTTPTPQH